MSSQSLIELPNKWERLDKPKRFKIIIGGRGGAKSESVAAIFAYKVAASGCNAVCCREFQTSIKQSVHSLVSRKIKDLELGGYQILNNEITNSNGGRITYQGLARDPQAIKSIDNAALCWVEEAHTLSEDSLEELTPSIRAEGSEIWMTANLQSSNDPFAKKFFIPFENALRNQGYYEDELHTIVWVNYDDNPWFPDDLDKERIRDEQTMSVAGYAHKWLGEPLDQVEGSIILPDWFNAAIDAHEKLGFKPQGIKVVSHDPSDEGPDPKSLCLRHGNIILDVQENDHSDVNDGCDWALNHAIDNNADLFVWDCDGLGVSLRRQVSNALNGKKMDNYMFKGSEGVENPNMIYQPVEEDSKRRGRTNKETFLNKRAQYCWKLRDMFYNTYCAVEKGEYRDPETLISISSSIERLNQLRSETCRIPIKQNNRGLIQIMSKKEMLTSFGIASPNLFDALFMSLKTPVIVKPQEKITPIPTSQRLGYQDRNA